MTIQEEKTRLRPSKYQFDQSEHCFQLFKDSIKSPDTAYMWTNALHIYMAYRKARKYSDLLKGKPEKVQQQLIEFVRYRKSKVRAQSVSVQLTGIRHFYFINSFKGLEWDIIRRFIGETIKAVQDVPYTHEQIRDMCKAAKSRIRICILSEAQGGPRIGAMPTITKGDLSRVERTKDDGTKTDLGFYRVQIYPGTKQAYITFFGPEASKEIDDYLTYRERCGEVITEDSPLIREEFDPKDKFQVKHPRRIGKKALAQEVSNAAVAAGVRAKKENGGPHQRHKVMLTHGLRKFFKKQCRKAGVDSINLEYLVGHKTGNPEFGVTSLMMTYDPAIEEDLLKEYMKAIDNLTIDPANRLQKQVKELEVKAKKADQVEHLEKIVINGKLETDAMMKQIAELKEQNKRTEDNHKKEMEYIISLIQQEPRLANVKPEVLARKKVEN